MIGRGYYDILNALPHIDALFSSKITPISRIKLDHRLSMLCFDDRKLLADIERIMHWGHIEELIEECILFAEAPRLLEAIKSDDIKQLLLWRLDLRTIMTALRRKIKGVDIPSKDNWSYGTRAPLIRRNWGLTTFGLQHAFPWVNDAVELLNNKETLKLEKLLLKQVWLKLDEMDRKHRFDFDAVVIYVLRWNLVARWTEYHSEPAVKRFVSLSENSLKQIDLSVLSAID